MFLHLLIIPGRNVTMHWITKAVTEIRREAMEPYMAPFAWLMQKQQCLVQGILGLRFFSK